ncbi:MAG: hypothetical protein CVV39_02830 [Planctomycetes bacterium HGW-Planctomycetes-1]|nr:MAG: hypothetical protein CVV39_02830 [Planctomycetes bacterium HGW-Planctomycetes-1]
MTEQKDLSQCCGNLLFPHVFKLFRIAIQPGRILTAFSALVIIFIAGWLMDFSKTVITSGKLTQRQLRTSTLTGSVTWPTELHCFVNNPERMDNFIKIYKDKGEKQGVFKVWSNFCLMNFNQAVVSLLQLKLDNLTAAISGCILSFIWLLKYHTVYGIIFLLISFAVISVAGGAICRGAALHFSKDEKIGIAQGVKFALRRFLPLFCAPTAPLVLVALLGLVIISVLGLITNIPWLGELVLALFFVIVLFAGLLISFAVIEAVAGLNLMFGAVAYDNSDTFDTISKSFNYVYSRPWRLGFYTLLAAVYGAISYLVVRFFAFVMLVMSRWFLQLGILTKSSKADQFDKLAAIWPKPEFFSFLGGGIDISRNPTESIAAFVVALEIFIISGLVIAFAVSFYFSAGAVIYCLLRNKADNIALEDVFIEAEQIAEPGSTEQTEQPAQTENSEEVQ